MLEVLETFERVAGRFSPIVLVLPGLILTALGLFIWLGGMGFRRIVLALVGGLMGVAGALCLVTQRPAILVLSALAVAFLAAVFQRVFAAALLGVLAATAAFSVLAWPSLQSREATLTGQRSRTGEGPTLAASESLEVVQAHWLDLATEVKGAARELAVLKWVVVGVVGLGLLAFGLVFRRLGGAMSCAIVGTSLIFAGLVMLLIFKGATPVAHIESRAVFYGLVFGSMAGFGTLEQFLLCRRAEDRRKARSKRSEANEEESGRSWRNR
jgi:hypothetical protein